ncbi:MAG: amine dehydrogenase large subunit [Panacagrimonas sp.]
MLRDLFLRIRNSGSLLIAAALLSACALTEKAPGPSSATPDTAIASVDPSPPALPIEDAGHVEVLSETYPEHWFWVFDPAFGHMLDGKVILVDADAQTVATQVQGTFNVSLMGSFVQGRRRPEIYAFESFASRGTRGVRTDVLTIYDRRTLAPLGEVVWPKPKRFQGLPHRSALQLIDDDRLLLAFNFNPATSVTVIDTASRRILNEIETPGCSMIYPTGRRGFSSLCANGSLMTTLLEADGKVISQKRSEPFFDTDRSPIFDRPALIGGVAYFPSFDGQVHPVDLRTDLPVVGPAWPLVPEAERAQGWRPGGLSFIDQDAQGRFYLLMHPDGREGTHSSGGSEVWVFDPASRQRVQRIALKSWGISLALSRGARPLLMVTNPEMSLEVYGTGDGKLLRTISGIGQETPLLVAGTY